MSRRNCVIRIVLIATPVAFIVLFIILIWDMNRHRPLLPEIQPREITMSSLTLPVVGILTEDCAAIPAGSSTLVVSGTSVAYPFTDGSPRGLSIRFRNALDGTLLWQSDETRFPFSMMASDSALFVTSSTNVREYDLHSGELLWQSDILPGHTGNVLLPDLQAGITIYYTQDVFQRNTAVILRLNPETGAINETERFPLEDYAQMVPFPDLRYVWLSGDALWLAGPPPSPETWRVQTGDKISGIAKWPLQYGSSFILSSGLFPRLIAIDAASGRTMWQDNREFISLPTMFHGTLYALTKGADLVALDPTTGLELGRADFTPSETETITRSHDFALSSSDEILLVYFGDSCQFFVFGTPGA